MTAPTTTSISDLRRKVHSLAKRFRLDYGEFEFHGVIEHGHTGGKLNFHLMFYGQYMPQQYVSRAAARRDIGIVADIQEVRSDAATIRYLAKDLVGYLSKDLSAEGRSLTSTSWLPSQSFSERLQAELSKARPARERRRPSPRLWRVYVDARGRKARRAVGPLVGGHP